MGYIWRDVNLDKWLYFFMLKGFISGGIIGTSFFGYGGSMVYVFINVCCDCWVF